MKILKIINSLILLFGAFYIFYLAYQTSDAGGSLTNQQKNGLIFMGVYLLGVFILSIIDNFKKHSKK